MVQIGRGLERSSDHFPAARLLGAGQRHVEQRSPGIGIDLDELRAIGSEMKIESQESSRRAGVEPGDRRGRAEDPLPITGQIHHAFHRSHDSRHAIELLRSNENGGGGE